MIKILAAAFLGFALIVNAAAQVPASVAPAPYSPPSLDDFFGDPQVGAAELSPSGRYLAYGFHENGVDALRVLDFETDKVISAFQLPPNVTVQWVRWKGEECILFAFELLEERRAGGKENGELLSYKYGRAVISMDRASGDYNILLGDNKNLTRWLRDLSNVASLLRKDPDHILMTEYNLTSGTPALYKVDVHTGHGDMVETGGSETISWFLDNSDQIVGRLDQIGNRALSLKTRIDPSSPWKEALQIKLKVSDDKPEFELYGPTPEPYTWYVRVDPKTPADGNTSVVKTYNFKTEQFGPTIWRNDRYDADTIVVGTETNAFLGACYVAEFRRCDFKNADTNANFSGLYKYFNNTHGIEVVSQSDDERYWLIRTFGPQDRGTLYRYDWNAKDVEEVAPQWPGLSAERLGVTEQYGYKARDGASIDAYLTMPHGVEKPPLVVLPHGGPELRDTFDFDVWAQFLATRGYAVFQPNFRGSSGYGKKFAEAGYGQWGGRMQDDITDGVKALIASGRIDANRICIVGGSYGGYAALYGGATHPELYKCVVSWAGISDLRKFVQYWRRTEGEKSETYKYWVKLIGDASTAADQLSQASPVTYASAYKLPVLLIHGDVDDIVPVEQSKAMNAALRASNHDVKLVIVKGEGHRDWLDFDEKAGLREMDTFLAAHIGAPPH